MGERALLPARLVAHRRPVLLGQEGLQVSQLDLDEVAMAALIQVLEQGAIEETAVGAEDETLMGGKLGQHLFHEGDDAIAGIGAAGAQPGLDDLLGRGAEGQQRVIGQGTAFMGVVALGRPFLATLDGLDGGSASSHFYVWRPMREHPTCVARAQTRWRRT